MFCLSTFFCPVNTSEHEDLCLAPRAYLSSQVSTQKSDTHSDPGVEISLYGKRPSLVSRAGTAHGEKAGQDGYVLLSDPFLEDVASSRAH